MVKIIDTHLETEAGPTAQVAQGDELLGLVANSPNVVVLGDINSAADGSQTPTYANLTKKLADAWSVKGPNDPGLSCCMKELLDNPTSTATSRIDVVLSKGALTATSATLTGNAPFRQSPAPTLGIGSFWHRRATGISEIEQPKALFSPVGLMARAGHWPWLEQPDGV